MAGLFCALKLSPRPVTVIAAAPIGRGASSAWAQAGIAAAVSPGDTVEKHVADTLAAGAGIVDERIARLMASEAADRIHDLLEYGVPFDRDLEGRLQTSREAAHSENRVVRVKGDMAGRAIMEALVAAVKATPTIRLMEGYVAEEITTAGRFVTGLVARPEGGKSPKRILFPARAVVMAAGGVGHLYEITTNPTEARGGGIGMAARAGAMIADPEFVQFHPNRNQCRQGPGTSGHRGPARRRLHPAQFRRCIVSCWILIRQANWPRGISWHAAFLPKSCPGAAHFSIAPRPSARTSRRSFRPSMAIARRPASIR